MTKNIIKILISISIIFLIALIQCQSFAADNSLTLSLESDKTQIKAGETVNVLVKVTNIQGEGIIGFNANVNYNSDIFECTANGDDDGIWTRQGFIENNLTTSRTDLEASKDNQTVAKLTLKAKSNAAIGEQTISLSQIEFATENESYNIADVATNIEIIEQTNPGEDEKPGDEKPGDEKPGDEKPGDEKPGDENPDGGNTAGGGSGNKKPGNTTIGNNNTSGKNTTTGKTLPKTGVSTYLPIMIIIIALTSMVCLYQYKKYRNI